MSILDTLNRLLGDPNERELKKLRPVVVEVKRVLQSDDIRALTAEDLPRKTEEFRKRLREGATTDQLLPEAFAVAVRACEIIKGRTAQMGKQTFVWDMVPFDVQLIGGIVLHQGKISEMKM